MPATEEQSEQVERQEAHVQELTPADSSKLEVLSPGQPRRRRCSLPPAQPSRPAVPRSPAPHRSAPRRSPSGWGRRSAPHYIGEPAAAAQGAGTRRPARIPPPHTHGRNAAGFSAIPPLRARSFPLSPSSLPPRGTRRVPCSVPAEAAPAPEGRQPEGRGGGSAAEPGGKPQVPREGRAECECGAPRGWRGSGIPRRVPAASPQRLPPPSVRGRRARGGRVRERRGGGHDMAAAPAPAPAAGASGGSRPRTSEISCPGIHLR